MSVNLSAEAMDVFKRHAAQRRSLPVDDSTREPYRELAREGLMIAGHSFTGGRESFYAMTEIGAKLARILERDGFIATSPAGAGGLGR